MVWLGITLSATDFLDLQSVTTVTGYLYSSNKSLSTETSLSFASIAAQSPGLDGSLQSAELRLFADDRAVPTTYNEN